MEGERVKLHQSQLPSPTYEDIINNYCALKLKKKSFERKDRQLFSQFKKIHWRIDQ